MTDLLAYHNALSQLECPDVPDTLYSSWLWDLDLKEEVTAHNMLNEAHLTGLVLCRTSALKQGVIKGNPKDLLHNQAVVQTDYRHMSMRLVHDSVEHCQMHLQVFMDMEDFSDFEEHLHRLFARLGQILLPLDLPDTVFDDKDSLDVRVDGTTSNIMSKSIIRWYMNIFVILFRHVELQRIAETPIPTAPRVQVENFHIEASRDDFYKHSQYFDLPPAAALCYATDFGDLLNNVSQITYFCYPEYKRRNLIEDTMVSTGDFPIYTLAAALSMFPNISVILEDDKFGSTPGILTPAASNVLWTRRHQDHCEPPAQNELSDGTSKIATQDHCEPPAQNEISDGTSKSATQDHCEPPAQNELVGLLHKKVDPLTATQNKKAGWRVVVAPGTILLLSDKGQVFKHNNILELLRAVPSQ